jgi:C-terminal processing protease CtpA/Prc
MAFSWHGDIYTLAEGTEPRRLDITLGVDGRAGVPAVRTERSGATEFAVAPSGKEIAFVRRGEVFVTSVDFATTRRITDTPHQERSVCFAPDGRTLYYAGQRDGSWDLYQSTIADEDELYFFSATKIEEKPLVATEADEFQPSCSPDGKKVAYLHERHEIRVVDVESGATITAVPGDAFYSYEDGDLVFGWSPDSQWITTQIYTPDRIFYSDVAVRKADGSGEIINLTHSGYDDNSPMFTSDGGAVLFASNRYGERAHGSWGSEYDVMGIFLTREAHDLFRLSKEEHQLREELEKKREDREKEKDGEKDENNEHGADDAPEADADDADSEDSDAKDDEDQPDPVVIELEGLDNRRERLTIHASDLGGFAMAADGDKLFYLARFEKGFDLWVHDFREESTKILTKLGADSASMRLSKDGEFLFILADGALAKIDPKSGERKGITFAATMTVDEAAERAHMFNHVWRQTKKKFYRQDMHGVDWTFYRDAYHPKLEGISHSRDFAILLSEILGELNASHTGGRYRPEGARGPSTAALGALYENDGAVNGLRIAEVLREGPLDRAELSIGAGDTILAIDGKAIDATTNANALLNGRVGDRVRLTIRSNAGEQRDVVVRPISLGEENGLLYDRWIRQREAIVEKASGGRIGYAHVRGMNDASFRAFFERVMGRHAAKEALIVDTRFNGGGWLHDDLATFLTGNAYVDLYPRNDLAPGIKYHGDPANRWNKPSIVVMSESNYSDAHFFPWVYAELGIGDTVGMPVPGTATAVWWERLYTGDIIFGIPQIGTKGAAGTYLENAQLEPTHRVPLPPEAAAAGTDTQLEAAVRVLLDGLDE